MPETVASLQAVISADTSDFEAGARGVSQSLSDLGRQAAGVGAVFMGMAVPIGMALRAAMSFEQGLAGVAKTTGIEGEALAELANGFRAMATSSESAASALPGALEQLVAIGEAAGQLGVTGQENILAFTDTISKLGIATDLTVDMAATQLARYANILGQTGDALPGFAAKMGDMLVALGNQFAATESEILNMSMRLAAAGAGAGVAGEQIMAIATAMAAVGLQAEAGGTAMTTVFKAINDAAASLDLGGASEELIIFSEIAGMTAQEFSEAWREDAAGALLAFTRGLGELDMAQQTAALDDLGLSGIRTSDTLLRLAGNSAELARALALAGDEMNFLGAASAEAERFGATAEGAMNRLGNSLTVLGTVVADAILPTFADFTEGLTELVAGLTAISPDLLDFAGKAMAVVGIVGALTLAITAVGAALGAILTPIGLVVSAIAGLGVAVFAVDWDATRRHIEDAIRQLGQTDFSQVGRDIILSIRDGLLSALEEIRRVGDMIGDQIKIAILTMIGEGPPPDMGEWFAAAMSVPKTMRLPPGIGEQFAAAMSVPRVNPQQSMLDSMLEYQTAIASAANDRWSRISSAMARTLADTVLEYRNTIQDAATADPADMPWSVVGEKVVAWIIDGIETAIKSAASELAALGESITAHVKAGLLSALTGETFATDIASSIPWSIIGDAVRGKLIEVFGSLDVSEIAGQIGSSLGNAIRDAIAGISGGSQIDISPEQSGYWAYYESLTAQAEASRSSFSAQLGEIIGAAVAQIKLAPEHIGRFVDGIIAGIIQAMALAIAAGVRFAEFVAAFIRALLGAFGISSPAKVLVGSGIGQGIVDGIVQDLVNAIIDFKAFVTRFTSDLEAALVAHGIDIDIGALLGEIHIDPTWAAQAAISLVLGLTGPVGIALSAVAAGIRVAWEQDTFGIRTAIEGFFETHIRPGLETLMAQIRAFFGIGDDGVGAVAAKAVTEASASYEDLIAAGNEAQATLGGVVSSILGAGWDLFVSGIERLVYELQDGALSGWISDIALALTDLSAAIGAFAISVFLQIVHGIERLAATLGINVDLSSGAEQIEGLLSGVDLQKANTEDVSAIAGLINSIAAAFMALARAVSVLPILDFIGVVAGLAGLVAIHLTEDVADVIRNIADSIVALAEAGKLGGWLGIMRVGDALAHLMTESPTTLAAFALFILPVIVKKLKELMSYEIKNKPYIFIAGLMFLIHFLSRKDVQDAIIGFGRLIEDAGVQIGVGVSGMVVAAATGLAAGFPLLGLVGAIMIALATLQSVDFDPGAIIAIGIALGILARGLGFIRGSKILASVAMIGAIARAIDLFDPNAADWLSDFGGALEKFATTAGSVAAAVGVLAVAVSPVLALFGAIVALVKLISDPEVRDNVGKALKIIAAAFSGFFQDMQFQFNRFFSQVGKALEEVILRAIRDLLDKLGVDTEGITLRLHVLEVERSEAYAIGQNMAHEVLRGYNQAAILEGIGLGEMLTRDPETIDAIVGQIRIAAAEGGVEGAIGFYREFASIDMPPEVAAKVGDALTSVLAEAAPSDIGELGGWVRELAQLEVPQETIDDIVRSMAPRIGAAFSEMGLEARKEFADALAEAGASERVVRYLLTPAVVFGAEGGALPQAVEENLRAAIESALANVDPAGFASESGGELAEAIIAQVAEALFASAPGLADAVDKNPVLAEALYSAIESEFAREGFAQAIENANVGAAIIDGIKASYIQWGRDLPVWLRDRTDELYQDAYSTYAVPPPQEPPPPPEQVPIPPAWNAVPAAFPWGATASPVPGERAMPIPAPLAPMAPPTPTGAATPMPPWVPRSIQGPLPAPEPDTLLPTAPLAVDEGLIAEGVTSLSGTVADIIGRNLVDYISSPAWEGQLQTFGVDVAVRAAVMNAMADALQDEPGLAEAFGSRPEVAQSIMNAVMGVLGESNIEAPEQNIGAYLLEAIKQSFEDGMVDMPTWWQDRAFDLDQGLRSALGMSSPATLFYPHGEAIIQGVQEGVVQGTPGAIEGMNAQLRIIASAVAQKARRTFKAAGEAMIEGIKIGILDQIDALKAAVVEAAMAARSAMDEALGVHSPSRVFARTGRYIVVGLMQGIAGEQGRLARLMSTLVDPGALRTGRTATVTNNNTQNFYFQPHYGGDGNARDDASFMRVLYGI